MHDDLKRLEPGASGLTWPFAALAGAVFCAIAFATLCPQSLRPHLGPADIERFGAYMALGLCVACALPRRPLPVMAIVVVAAFGLEAAQRLVPGRDAHLNDAMVKATGGLCGAILGLLSADAVDLVRGGRPSQ
jgi:VanZ family protein